MTPFESGSDTAQIGAEYTSAPAAGGDATDGSGLPAPSASRQLGLQFTDTERAPLCPDCLVQYRPYRNSTWLDRFLRHLGRRRWKCPSCAHLHRSWRRHGQ